MNWIKWNRERLGITQEQLAKDLGFSRTLITKWETGRAAITIENTKLICDYFKIDQDIILSPAYVEGILEKRRKSMKSSLFVGIICIALILVSAITFAIKVSNGFEIKDGWDIADLVFLCLDPIIVFYIGWYSQKEYRAIKDERSLLIGYIYNKVPKEEKDGLYKMNLQKLKEKLISLKTEQ